jgi:hypothetical protein
VESNWVHSALRPLIRPTVPASGDYDGGEIGGMIGRGNRSTRRKPVPVPLCPPHTPDATRIRTRASEVGSQRLTAWATAQHNAFTFTLPLQEGRGGEVRQSSNEMSLNLLPQISLYYTVTLLCRPLFYYYFPRMDSWMDGQIFTIDLFHK